MSVCTGERHAVRLSWDPHLSTGGQDQRPAKWIQYVTPHYLGDEQLVSKNCEFSWSFDCLLMTTDINELYIVLKFRLFVDNVEHVILSIVVLSTVLTFPTSVFTAEPAYAALQNVDECPAAGMTVWSVSVACSVILCQQSVVAVAVQTARRTKCLTSMTRRTMRRCCRQRWSSSPTTSWGWLENWISLSWFTTFSIKYSVLCIRATVVFWTRQFWIRFIDYSHSLKVHHCIVFVDLIMLVLLTKFFCMQHLLTCLEVVENYAAVRGSRAVHVVESTRRTKLSL